MLTLHQPVTLTRRLFPVVVLTACMAGAAAVMARADDPALEKAREKELAERAAGERLLKAQAEQNLQVQVLVQQPPVFNRPGGAMDLGGSFDQMVFGVGGPNPVPPGADTAARLSQVRKAGEERIEKIHRLVRLSDEQRAKLRVAMEADVSRLAEEIDAIRALYVGQKVELGEDGAGQERYRKLTEDVRECQRLMAAAFGPAALLSKVLGDTLDEPQLKRYTETMAARRGTIWKALIGSVLGAHEGVLGLTQAQHEAIEALLMADVPPLALELAGQRVTGAAVTPAGLVITRLEQAGEEKLAVLLDPRQRAVVAALAKQVGEPVELEAQLVAGGILEENP